MRKIRLISIFVAVFLILSFSRSSGANAQINHQIETTAIGTVASGGGGSMTGDVYFYCQYGGVNAAGKLNDPSFWNVPSGHAFSDAEEDAIGPSNNQCDITGNGCGPTSTAMIMSTKGDQVNPIQVARANNNNGCGGSFGGTSAFDIITYTTPYLKSRGFTVTGNLVKDNKLNTAAAKRFLSDGYLILAGANMRYMTNTGYHLGKHAFVLSGYTDASSDNFTAYDPTFCENLGIGGERSLSNVSTIGGAGNDNIDYWMYAFAITKN